MNVKLPLKTTRILTPGQAAKQAAQIKARTSWQLTMRRLVRDPASVGSAAVIVLAVLFAVCAPLVAQWVGLSLIHI